MDKSELIGQKKQLWVTTSSKGKEYPILVEIVGVANQTFGKQNVLVRALKSLSPIRVQLESLTEVE